MSKTNLKICILLKQLLNIIDMCDEEEIDRRYWVNPFLQRRDLHSLEAHLLKDILWDSKDYQNFCRMDINNFEKLLSLVDNKIRKQDTAMRCSINSRVRLAVTLRFLATGDSYRSLEYLSRISRKTISVIVPEVLTAVYEALQPKYLKAPSTEEEWKNIAEDFNNLWQFPHTLGAVDGKHIRIKNPKHSGSNFYNYKGFFSTVLLAVVDASSKFLYIDVGGNGRASDVVVFKNSTLHQSIKQGKLNIPSNKALPGQIEKTAFFIGDDIFGLDHHFMKAYNTNSALTVPEEIFNYRLSRARMTVEMAFGRLASRFRIFHRPIEVELSTIDNIVQVCCVLHNYLSKDLNIPININEDLIVELPQTICPLPTQIQETVRFANQTRDNVKRYLVTEGNVPFQWSKIKKQVAQEVSVVID